MDEAIGTVIPAQQEACPSSQSETVSIREAVGSFGWLPCQLTVEVPISRFRLRNLMALAVGSVIDTKWQELSDIPLRVNGRLIGRAKFEVSSDQMAIRITELA
jgi:flagellar motor switch/type III secretory pathway protein FliN